MLASLILVASLALTTSPLEQRLEEASVTLRPGSCAGVVAGDRMHVVTAAHCIAQRTGTIPIAFHSGEAGTATPEAVMPDQDVAILRLDKPAPVRALELSPGLPSPGTEVYFRGQLAHGHALQTAVVARLAPCPSLPRVPAALHTTIRGEPGDSGAPLIDAQLRVVGLVHGGAMCSIAAPAAPAAPVLATLELEGAQCVGPGAPTDDEIGVGGSGSTH